MNPGTNRDDRVTGGRADACSVLNAGRVSVVCAIGPHLVRQGMGDDKKMMRADERRNPKRHKGFRRIGRSPSNPLILTTDQEVGDSSSSGRANRTLAPQGVYREKDPSTF